VNTTLLKEQAAAQALTLREELTLDIRNLSAKVNKKISKPDSRPSSMASGFLAIGLLCAVLAAIFITDIPKLLRDLKGMGNCKKKTSAMSSR
jgi:hypothetical protein